MPKTQTADAAKKSPAARGVNDRLTTPTDLDPAQTKKVAEALNGCLADAFVLYMKIKNFHWHVSGPNFRDYHEMLDEHAAAVFATTDPLAERVRKIGHRTLTSFAETLEKSSLEETASADLSPDEMLRIMLEDNKAMAKGMREAHAVCDEADDVASASLLENYIDETEKRTWFLFEISRAATASGH